MLGALGAVYSYFLYPAVLLLLKDLPSLRPRGGGSDWTPKLTLIVAAHNELSRIRQKLEESIALREVYADLEILVASDASSDGTDDIVQSFGEQGVDLVRTTERNGKEFAQREAIKRARGDIIIFTDTGTTIVPSSISRLVEIFADATIGSVSSTDRIVNPDGSVTGEGLYIRYEMWLRDLESRKRSLIGLSGSFFAATHEVCRLWDTDIPSDLAVAINSNILGLRAISDPDVIGVYRDARDPRHEFRRKIRTVIRGMTALAKKREVLNPFRFGWLSFQLWSHKILRWAVPWFGLCYLLGGALALRLSLVNIVWLVHVAVLVGFAAVGAVSPALRSKSVVGAAYFYLQVNFAALFAAVQFLAGKRVTTWAPTMR